MKLLLKEHDTRRKKNGKAYRNLDHEDASCLSEVVIGTQHIHDRVICMIPTRSIIGMPSAKAKQDVSGITGRTGGNDQ